MWIQRTADEVAKWNQAAERKARSDGLQIGIMAWLGATVLLSAGWIVSFRTGVAIERNFGGTFWTRLPIFAVVTLPIVFIASRYERKKALRKEADRTICPKCDTAAVSNAGAACGCGGTYVPQSTMKWVEEKEEEPAL